MSDNRAAVHDSLRRRLAAVDCVAPIVDCIRKMRVRGLADNEIAGLFRPAGSGDSLAIFLVEDAYSSGSKSLLHATTREFTSIQNGIQMSAFEAMAFRESGLDFPPARLLLSAAKQCHCRRE